MKGEIAEEHAHLLHKSIIYQDKEIIAINKPSGIPVQGGTKSQEKNIDRWLPALRKNVRPIELSAFIMIVLL